MPTYKKMTKTASPNSPRSIGASYVQNRDVSRFNEILGPEFYCSNLDKSLPSASPSLNRPRRRWRLRNLQVHDVKIHIMGDFAIIHAAFSYTTADRESRARVHYTD